MATNHPNGASARSGSQQNHFQPDNLNSTNTTASNNLYQQLCSLAGALSSGNVPQTVGSANSTRTSHENVIINPSILNQLLSMNTSVDTSAVRNVQSSIPSEPAEGNNISSLFLNAQAPRQNSMSSILSSSSTGAIPLNLLAFLLEKQSAAYAPPSTSLGADETQISRNDDSLDPNLLKLQKLLATLPAAGSMSQNHLNSNNVVTAAAASPSLTNQVALLQLLASAIQQNPQINRGANSVPTTVNFQRPPSPNFSLSSQAQVPSTSSSTAKMGSKSMSVSDNVLKQQGSWLSSASGDIISSPDLVDATTATMQNVSLPTSHSFPKSRPSTHTQSLVVDAGSSPTTTSSSHPSKTAPVSVSSQNLLHQMQSWSVSQLEKHVSVLMEFNQPIPQAVHHLLTDARRKEDKRNAKRVANRKSACTSRARKKALVEDMTRTNERLRRQALILSLLPDLVISITVGGEITFCSDQVERVLHHKVNDLCGANIDEIIIPASRDALHRLIQNLTAAAEQAEASSGGGCSDQEGSGGCVSDAAAIISEGSSGSSLVTFPLSEVNVKNYNRQLQLEKLNRGSDTSDLSQHNVSMTASSNSVSRSGTLSSFGNQSHGYSSMNEAPISTIGDRKTSDDDTGLKPSARLGKKLPSDQAISEKSDQKRSDRFDGTSNGGDDSCSSLSADNGKEQLTSDKQNCDSSAKNTSPKNSESSSASSELSDEKLNKNGSENSGYRESTESENSDSDGSNSNDIALQSRPLAPTCNICLIREDLSTIWCEVTSSIYSSSPLDDRSITPSAYGGSCKSFQAKKESDCSKDQDGEAPVSPQKELLLCLRPIRDGSEKVGEELKFRPPVRSKLDNEYMNDNDVASDSGYPTDFPDSIRVSHAGNAPLSHGVSSSKRRSSGTETGPSRKRAAITNISNDTEKTVAESLMLMSYFQ